MMHVAERPMPGGPLALDLVNTRWLSTAGPIDWLDTDAAVELFVVSHGAEIGSNDVATCRAALVRARGLVQRLLDETQDRAVSDALVDEVNTALRGASVELCVTPDGPLLEVGHADPAERVSIAALVNAIELLRGEGKRVRCCAHEQCVLWFHDTSKGGRRRWCSMERCGNRTKAKRHHERNRHQPRDETQDAR